MGYKVKPGIKESELSSWLEQAAKRYGVFKDGRVNYTDADTAPVVMCTVYYGGRILLAKRGYGLADAEGYWSTINGFIDESKPVKEIAVQEMREELSVLIKPNQVRVGKSYAMKNSLEKRLYIVFPCLVKLQEKPRIKLDYEHTDFTWIKRPELENFHILEDLPLIVDSALKLL